LRALFSVVVYFYTGNLHLYLDIFATTKNFRSYCEECSDVFRSRWISVQKFGWNSPVFGKYRSYWLWPVNDLIGNADYFLAIILSEFQISFKIWSNLKNLGRKPAYWSYQPLRYSFLIRYLEHYIESVLETPWIEL